MPWFKLDDKGWCHPKVMAAGNRAYGAWCRAGQWASQQMSDGFVPASICRAIDQAPSVWVALLKAGMIQSAEGGYTIHDYLAYNPSRAQLEAKQAAQREGGRAGAKARWDGYDYGSTHGSSYSLSKAAPHDDSNAPTRPLTSPIGEGEAPAAPASPPVLTHPDPGPKRQRRLPLKTGKPTVVDSAWGLWRKLYRASRRQYGKYAENGSCSKAMLTVARRAHEEAVARQGEHGGDVPVLELQVLDFWFKSYLRDDGRGGFLADNRHALQFLTNALTAYGLPWKDSVDSASAQAEYQRDLQTLCKTHSIPDVDPGGES